jgi:hypothetical protein
VFSLSNQPVGLYIIHITTDAKTETVKVIKQ